MMSLELEPVHLLPAHVAYVTSFPAELHPGSLKCVARRGMMGAYKIGAVNVDKQNLAEGIRDRAARLFEYLAERTRLTSRPVLDIRASKTYEPILWLERALPDEPEVWSLHRHEADDEEEQEEAEAEFGLELIRILRVVPQESPDPPEVCRNWIHGGSDAINDWKGEPPTLLELRLEDNPNFDAEAESSNEPEHIELRLQDHPPLIALWNDYIENQWKPWQTERLRIGRIQQVYTKLFEIRATVDRDDEEYELIAASSLLVWKDSKFGRGGDTIYRHLVTMPVRIEIEGKTGTIRVFTDPEAPAPKLETEMIPPTRVPAPEGAPDIERGDLGDVRVLVASPLNGAAVHKAMRPWCFNLSGEAKVSRQALPPERIAEDKPPEVTFAPALILRKRPATSLTVAFETCEKQILEGGEVPFNVQRIVEQIEDLGYGGANAEQGEQFGNGVVLPEPLFPLPSNQEQFRIARRLAASHGVLVQGPPGTGKTHTIANLICHLLAEGKRILVTSAKARPLMVLHEKLPADVRPLCLTSLGGGRDESEQLKRSVDGILKHFTAYDPDENRQRVDEIEREIRRLRGQAGRLLNQRRERLEIETRDQHVADGAYRGSSMEIIGRVMQEKETLGWIEDSVPEELACPVGDQWNDKVLSLLKALPAEVRSECGRTCPPIDRLMEPAVFSESAERQRVAAEELKVVREEIQKLEQEVERQKEAKTQSLQQQLDKARAELTAAQNDLAVENRRARREQRKIDERLQRLHQDARDEKRLRTTELESKAHEARHELAREERNQPQQAGLGGDKLAQRIAQLELDQIERATALVRQVESTIAQAASEGWQWPQRASFDLISGTESVWATVFSDSRSLVSQLPDAEQLRNLDELIVRTSPNLSHDDIYFDAKELLGHYRAGGGNGLLFFKPAIVKRTKEIQRSTVNGRACNGPDPLSKLVSYLESERILERLHESWSSASRRIRQIDPTDNLVQTASALRKCHEFLDRIYAPCIELRTLLGGELSLQDDVASIVASVKRAHQVVQEHQSSHSAWLRRVDGLRRRIKELELKTSVIIEQIDNRLKEDAEAIQSTFKAPDESRVEDRRHEVRDIEEELDAAREVIADDGERRIAPKRRQKERLESHLAELRKLREGTRQAVALTCHAPAPHPLCKKLLEAIDAADSTAYSDGVARLKELELHRPTYRLLKECLEPLQKPAPKTCDWLMTAALDYSVEQKLQSFQQAWAWTRAHCWVQRYRSTSLTDIDQEFRRTESAISELTAEQCSLLAWRHCKESSTQAHQEALKAWEKAIKRVGKGKGKYAAKHQRDAHRNMKIAQGMIPALVTPLARLVESLAIRPGMFDVVIVDEASQLGPEGLLLFYLAKQVVVVGDDEQISPENVGIDRSHLHALINKFLKDAPSSDSLSENSLFDQADIRFTGGRIMLREHFRCVPEIIAFSNQLCYRDEMGSPQLIALRKVGGERLRPALQAQFVVEGHKNENNVNEPEAEAIVAAVAQCMADPQYDGKTFGVVSLLGKNQADHIQRRLIETVGTDAIEKRRLICGDAYSFQGDERNVMFLSLVVANNARFAKLTKKSDKQRFNVAASRAKDQMWLFHSVSLNDLDQEDLRYQLLNHCTAMQEGKAYLLEEELEKCDSDFEREVARRIWNRGYRVWCQVKVAHYRIDLVVEGANGGQLAVECDGDRYHGPDRFEADVQRQRILERCGWRFWRVWGSEFAAAPQEALNSLWSLLDSEGIHPVEGVTTSFRSGPFRGTFCLCR